jgi:hypothetical protein
MTDPVEGTELPNIEEFPNHDVFSPEQLSENAIMVSKAVHRLESFAFAMVKILIDSGVATLEEVEAARADLLGYEDLLVYWKSGPKEEG